MQDYKNSRTLRWSEFDLHYHSELTRLFLDFRANGGQARHKFEYCWDPVWEAYNGVEVNFDTWESICYCWDTEALQDRTVRRLRATVQCEEWLAWDQPGRGRREDTG